MMVFARDPSRLWARGMIIDDCQLAQYMYLVQEAELTVTCRRRGQSRRTSVNERLIVILTLAGLGRLWNDRFRY
jgi:hypothetical protein